MSYGMGEVFNVNSTDVNYIPLPLYHSNGGIVGVGMTLLRGNTAAIRKKFSASKCIEDCRKCGATVSVWFFDSQISISFESRSFHILN